MRRLFLLKVCILVDSLEAQKLPMRTMQYSSQFSLQFLIDLWAEVAALLVS